ncbi:hypothetical protein ACFX13_004067 [Malus domestica]
MRDDESLSSYLTRLNKIINQMRTFGESRSNKRLVQNVLISLSKPYDSICLVIENTKCLETVELQEVVAILKSQEQQFDLHNVDTTEKAFASFSFGHWARECTAGKIVQKANSVNQEVTGNLFYADSAISETNNWYIDSGCNNHMIRNADLLVDIRTNVAGKVQTPTGALVIVAGMGSLEIDTNKGKKYIRKVMYIPGLKENLLSVGQTDEHGYYLLFGEGICSIFDGPSLDNLVIKVKKKENICYPLSLWKNNQLVFRKLALIQVLPGFGTRD